MLATEPLNDEALMARVAGGDTDALDLLYHRYARVVYGLALRILANPQHAEDVVQETFWRVWSRGATFQITGGSFPPWLFGIARNHCIDELRRRQARPATRPGDDSDILLAIPDGQPGVDDLTWEGERRRLIISALADLPDDQREVIELAYFNGLSQREIAERLNNPLGTVKTRVRLALQKLKGLLEHLNGE
ncbi:sigma-70 family RNA polymerase sigma factor [Oscillochloris sp. ZM17-4]|uniref:RNA polymerase sigma factor n=1 Tax=Oscillochloris sp. ZM17-4 TaxID=2866714 RepID=UPI001C72F3C1|nr:sigma-70 family RNA polymerase sigma factor [Oscillochloris sp. ZM17-4]MBX0327312.1 sigma-70 family RNA polymerase sigma factor [Oscillochloris sp. ZM17-4]